jgi:hypothetical protein
LAEFNGWPCEVGDVFPQHVVPRNGNETFVSEDNRIDVYASLRAHLQELPQNVPYDPLNAGVESDCSVWVTSTKRFKIDLSIPTSGKNACINNFRNEMRSKNQGKSG